MSHQACPKLLLAMMLLLCLAAIQVNSLDCVQCSSHGQTECNIVGLIPPTRCPDGSYYCVMTMVLHKFNYDRRLVTRSCSPTKQSSCKSYTVNHESTVICHDSCAWDGCNAPRRPTL